MRSRSAGRRCCRTTASATGSAIILALCATLGSLTAAQWQGAMDVSASFVCVMLAAAYLGPAEAFAVVVFSESVAWLSQRYRPQALVVNLAAIGIPALIAGTLMDALVTDATSRVEFLALLAAAAVINLTVNFVLACSLLALMDGLSAAAGPAAAGAAASRRSGSPSHSRSPWQRCTSASAWERAPSSSPAERRRLHVHGSARRHRTGTNARVRQAVVGGPVGPHPDPRPARRARRSARCGSRRVLA